MNWPTASGTIIAWATDASGEVVAHRAHRVRTRQVPLRDVRRELQPARTGVVLPVNYLIIRALLQYDQFFGPDFTVEYPDPLRPPADPAGRSPGPHRPARLRLAPRTRRPATRLRRRRPAAHRPRVEGTPCFVTRRARRQRRRPVLVITPRPCRASCSPPPSWSAPGNLGRRRSPLVGPMSGLTLAGTTRP